jgi:signal transduction histidine kinase
MPPEAAQRLFAPFVRGHPGYPGLGLGLSLARSIVELHGGELGGSSPGVGRGAAFTIRLPYAPPRA